MHRNQARRALLILTTTTGLTLSITGIAVASVLSGTTSQKKPITLTTGASGRLVKVKYSWSAHCQRPKSFFSQSGVLTLRPAVNARFFHQFAPRSSQGPYRFHINAGIRGHKVSASLWRRSIFASIAVFRAGKQVDSCQLGTVTWQAR